MTALVHGQGRFLPALVLGLLFSLVLACGGSDDDSGNGGGGQGATSGSGESTGSSSQPSGDTLTVPDSDTLTVQTIDLPVPGDEVIYAFDAAWVFFFDLDNGAGLRRVDPASGEVGELIEVPTATPSMLAGSDALWLLGRALFRVAPTTSEVEEIAFQDPPQLGFTPQWGIWDDRVFAVSDEGVIYELDTTAGTFSMIADSGATDANTAAFSGQYVWIENVADGPGGALDFTRTLTGIDLSTGSEVASMELDATPLGAGDGAIWALSAVLGNDGHGYYRIDPATGDTSFQELDFGETPFLTTIFASGGSVWVGYQGFSGGDFVLRVNGSEVSRTAVSLPFPDIAAGDDEAWLVSSDEPTLERISP